jgi:hypothetical protein
MPRRSPPGPRETPEEHARRRAWERYGLELSHRDYWVLGTQIAVGDGRRARYGADLHSGRQTWLVLHGDRWLFCLWCPRTKQIVTFLPLGAEVTDGELRPAPIVEEPVEAAPC